MPSTAGVPNDPTTRMKVITTAEPMAGSSSGAVIHRNCLRRERPAIAPASSSWLSTLVIELDTER